jgi:hypothetical protein
VHNRVEETQHQNNHNKHNQQSRKGQTRVHDINTNTFKITTGFYEVATKGTPMYNTIQN